MKVNHGKVHKYLGMTLDFTTKHQVKITMTEYVEDVIKAWNNTKGVTDDEGFTIVQPKQKKAELVPHQMISSRSMRTRKNYNQ